MSSTGNRYRGAQPFGDDYVSRRTFFGRGEAAQALTDQILANRLMVVYAKSGLGKSSLLNAGVAPLLRQAGLQPLLLRITDAHLGPTPALLQSVRAEAARQGVEFVDGEAGSLWRYFKTVEFWQDDRLLTPVLIIDQFEELFTLHGEAVREAFLAEFGPLARGIAPPGEDDAGEGAPTLHIVLSLREDFLGLLEDASDRIPQILDHRYRLLPLDREAAIEAIAAPARLQDPALKTQPFEVSPAFAAEVLEYLMGREGAGGRRSIEPFHLQLICQRIEGIASGAIPQRDKRRWNRERPFEMADFGGPPALAETLTRFYSQCIATVSERPQRKLARRLCEQYLINPEGRRLSLEQHEIVRQLEMSEQALDELVASRLLRTDRRSDSVYYEIGHDALVEPILRSQRGQAMALGWAATVAGTVGVGAFLLLFVACLFYVMTQDEKEWAVLVFISILFALSSFLPARVLQFGVRTRERYRARQGPVPAAQGWPGPSRLRRLCGAALMWAAGLSGAFILLILGIAAFILVLLFFDAALLPPDLAKWLGEHTDSQHPFRQPLWIGFESLVITCFLFQLWRAGRGIRAGQLHAARGLEALLADAPASAGWRTDGLLLAVHAGLLAMAIAVGLALRQCATTTKGKLPGWIRESILSQDLPEACLQVYAQDWDLGATLLVLFVIASLFLALRRLLPPALRAVASLLEHQRSRGATRLSSGAGR